MIYRRFGRTGLELSVLSFGCMRSMHSWQPVVDAEIPPASNRNLEEIVQAALDTGINHFETAHGYGTSEQQLGHILRRIPRDRYLLQTKVRPSADPKKFLRDFSESLDRLGMDRVDLLAIHGINTYRDLWHVCREGGCLEAARRLQREGKAGWIGFSGHGPAEVILAAIRHHGCGGFDYVNLHWYYIFQVNMEALREAAARDMGVFIISPTDKGGMLQDPPQKLRALCAPLEPMVFNDAFCLRRVEIHTISVGAARPDDFKTHLQALSLVEKEADIDRIDASLRHAMEEATGGDRPEAHWSKLPPWERCPGLINIRFILWLHNLARGWGLVRYCRERYRKLGREVEWVPGCNGKEAAAYDLGPVAERIGMDGPGLARLLLDAHRLLGDGDDGWNEEVVVEEHGA
ncbi:MAG: aldo/keto reductase [Desulfobulbaceae bacterium]